MIKKRFAYVPETLLPDFYDVLEFQQEADNGCAALLALNPGHAIFEGHFPGLPIVPGVCMMQMAKEMLERALGSETRLQSARNIKFLAILNPHENPRVRLTCTYQPAESGQVTAESTLCSPDGTKVFFKMKGTFQRVSAS